MMKWIIIWKIVGFLGIIFQSVLFWIWFLLREELLINIGFYSMFSFLVLIIVGIFFISYIVFTRPDWKKKGLLSLSLLSLNLLLLAMHGVLAEILLRRTYVIFCNMSRQELREVTIAGSLWYHAWNRIGKGGIRFVHFYPEPEGIYEIGLTMGNKRKTFKIYAMPGDMFRIKVYSDTVTISVKN